MTAPYNCPFYFLFFCVHACVHVCVHLYMHACMCVCVAVLVVVVCGPGCIDSDVVHAAWMVVCVWSRLYCITGGVMQAILLVVWSRLWAHRCTGSASHDTAFAHHPYPVRSLHWTQTVLHKFYPL